MRVRRGWAALAPLVLVLALAVPVRGPAAEGIRLQLKWVPQAQFAGYYAALDQGYYEDEGLDVEILPGGPDITPEQVVAGGQAEFGLDWLASLLSTRDQGSELVNVAQVFTRGGMTEVTWKDTGLDSIDDLAGKKVGVWCCGNQYQLLAALRAAGMDPDDPSSVEIVDQPFDMNLFLNREVDAAAAMTYNELAQILETENPATGELYTLDDLNVMRMSDIGTGMMEDGMFVRADWISEEANQDITVRFLKATFKGWVFCRDNFEECLDIVLANGPTLGEGHQRWQLNEINALIWPNDLGIGVMDPALYQLTADICLELCPLSTAPTDSAYVTSHAEEAVAQLEAEGVDVRGADYVKEDVEVTAGGE